jgi:hypothetical protein
MPYHSREPPAGTGGKSCSNARRVDALVVARFDEGLLDGNVGMAYLDDVD